MKPSLDPMMTSSRQDWKTPPKVFDPLHSEFSFTVDAAADGFNAMLPRYWTETDDGASQDWSGERVWCNPPYGKLSYPFIRKAALMEADVSVLLIPSRTDTAVWHDFVFPLAEVRFIRGRVRFVGAPQLAPFPSVVAVFRKKMP